MRTEVEVTDCCKGSTHLSSHTCSGKVITFCHQGVPCVDALHYLAIV